MVRGSHTTAARGTAHLLEGLEPGALAARALERSGGSWGAPELLVGTKTVQCGGQFGCFLQNLTGSACDAPLTLLDVYPNKPKTDVRTKTCAWIFIEALFIVAGVDTAKVFFSR